MLKKFNSNNRFFYVFLALLLLLVLQLFRLPQKADQQQYSEILGLFDQQKVTAFTLDLGKGDLKLTVEGQTQPLLYKVPNVGLFVQDVQPRIELYNKAHPDKPMQFDYKPVPETPLWLSVLPYVGSALMLGFMFYFLYMQNMGGKAMQVGKAKVKDQAEETGKKVTFADVAGADEEKEELQEVVEFLKNPARFNALGARIPKGVLLVGPPGTGKTLLAKGVAGEAGVPFYSISGSDFVEMYVGVGASRVRDLFERARKNAPSIVFIDEIDAVGRQRGAGLGGGHDEREQTLNQLLVEMDGFGTQEGVIIIAATNRPDILDKALLRPGRFDRQIYVGYPDVKGREAILRVHTRSKPLAPDVRIETIAKSTSGFTGADLENLVNEAALLAARHGRKAVTQEDVDAANIKVLAGPEKKSRVVTDKKRRLVAYHEAGHAIAGYHFAPHNPVHEISIVPRGRMGGYTWHLPEDDANELMTKNHMFSEIETLLGGRVAEQLVLDDISTGASSDLERATSIARSMVMRYGFSDKLGHVVYGTDPHETFLGRDFSQNRNYSETVASEIDGEIRSIIDEAYTKTAALLQREMEKLHELAALLLKNEKVSGEAFRAIMEEKPAPAAESETASADTVPPADELQLGAAPQEINPPAPEAPPASPQSL